jgi:hypothetical protein
VRSNSAAKNSLAHCTVSARGLGIAATQGRYEQSEREIQRLLGVERELVAVEGAGVEADADWRGYELPERLRRNHWALTGDWATGAEKVVLEQSGGSIAFHFHARDAHLVLSRNTSAPIPFRLLLDGAALGGPTASTSTRRATASSTTAADEGNKAAPISGLSRARLRR